MKVIELAARGVGRTPAVTKAETSSDTNPTHQNATAQRRATCGTSCATGLCADCQPWKQLHHHVTTAARLAREVG